MRTEYKRDMNHNYLVLHGEKEIDTSSYPVRMLVGNVIPGVLKCRIQGLDGKFLFYYEITSKQSISALFEQKKFRMEDLQLIFGSFVRVMEQMSEYLLNPGELLLTPDHMYLDVEKREIYFCCLPGNDREIQEQFRGLAEYILPKLDHEDEKAVVLGYGIYRKTLEERFQLESIKEELYQNREDSEGTDNFIEQCCKEEAQTTDGIPFDDIQKNEKENLIHKSPINDMFKQETKEKKEDERKWRLWIGGCIAGAVVVFGILLASMVGIIPWLPVEVVILCGAAALGIGILIAFVVEKKQKRNLQVEEWRENVKKGLLENENQLFTHENENAPVRNAEDFKEKKNLSVFVAAEDILHNKEEAQFGETVVLSANPMNGPASLVSREPGELATIYLKEELTVIGKLPNAADAIVSLPTVSRVHARIRKQGEEYLLTDLNSRNGTSVNGVMLKGNEEYLLKNEDEVDFAQARYIFLK